MPEEERLLSRSELADRWGVSTMFVHRLDKAGRIESVRISPKTIRYRLSDVIRFEDERTTSGRSA